MAIGCILSLLIWIGSAVAFFLAFDRFPTAVTEDSRIFVAIALGFGCALVFLQLWGIVSTIQKYIASKQEPGSWSDGQFVGISGRLQVTGEPVRSPVSDQPAGILEFEVKEITSTGKDRTTVSAYHGFLMATCGIQGPRGFVQFSGFPLLTKSSKAALETKEQALKLAQFLTGSVLTVLPNSPVAAAKELTGVLSSKEASVYKVFVQPSTDMLPPLNADASPGSSTSLNIPASTAHSPSAAELEDLDPEEAEELLPPDLDALENSRYSSVEEFAAALDAGNYFYEEKLFAVGEEVTAFGTYRQDKRALEIGSGFSNFKHSLDRGGIEKVLFRAALWAIIALLFWAIVLTGGVILAFPSFGADLTGMLQTYCSQSELGTTAQMLCDKAAELLPKQTPQ